MDEKLAEVIRFLNAKEIRATYTAVAEYLNVLPISMGKRLGRPHVAASWIVGGKSGLPTGYGNSELHPALRAKDEMIRRGKDLGRRISAWKAGTDLC
jgi:hypothetical protein